MVLFPDYKDINLFSQWIDTDKVSINRKSTFLDRGNSKNLVGKCGGMN